jgi:hypothetical protein
METPRPRNPTRSRPVSAPRPAYQPVATIEVDAVLPSDRGFTLTGQGVPPDRGVYRLELRFELPLDPRTRTVLGELLSQSGLSLSRRDTASRNS